MPKFSVKFIQFCLVAFLLILSACAKSSETSATDPSSESGTTQGAPEYPAPDFRFAVLDGEDELGPHDFMGKIVIVDLWATWCGPCRLQAEYLEALREQVSEDDVQFMALNIGEEEETVRRFTNDTPFPYPVLLDPEDTTTGKFDIVALPTVMIVGRDGEVAWMRTGISDVDKLREALAVAGLELPPLEAEPNEA